MGINLKAYRFSESELKKLIQMRQLFSENNLVTDRFPEVYYDDIKNYETLFGLFEATNEDTPDYLGVYHYDFESDKLTTKEGIIVLFKDRIEAFCKRKSVGKDEVRYIVLMHELGHWLAHWSEFNDENWKKGYGIDNPMTHEAIAQLIAFWAVDGDPVCEEILRESLTPKDERNKYALYLILKSHSKSEILKKLIEIRKYFFLNEYFQFELLKSNAITMIDFISGLFSAETLKKLREEIENIKIPFSENLEVFEEPFCKNLIGNLERIIDEPKPKYDIVFHNTDKLDVLLKKLFINMKSRDEVLEFLKNNYGKIAGKNYGL
jgi:hypothetical protein